MYGNERHCPSEVLIEESGYCACAPFTWSLDCYLSAAILERNANPEESSVVTQLTKRKVRNVFRKKAILSGGIEKKTSILACQSDASRPNSGRTRHLKSYSSTASDKHSGDVKPGT